MMLSLCVIEAMPLQLSVAVAFPVADGVVLAVHATVMFAGQEITGPALSRTVMIWVQVAEVPQLPMAFHVL